MKIVTKKQMRLDELIKYVWEKEDYPNRFVNNFNGEVVFNGSGKFMTDDSFISHNSLFTVEVTEELTEDTEFKELTEIYYDTNAQKIQTIVAEDSSISMFKKADGGIFKSLAIYHRNTLIWSKDTGIPTEGTLEL